MAKVKSIYVCQSCGAASPRWQGKCPECEEWNTLAEEEAAEEGAHKRLSIVSGAAPRPITEDNLPLQIA